MIPISKQNTSVLKGIAICAMLFHHLYCSVPDWTEPYRGLLLNCGELGKVCVAMFLFCSGYGLAVQYERIKGLKNNAKFVLKRFLSFYVNYWTVFFVFVPITVFIFHRPLAAAYGENVNIWGRLGMDIMGVMGFSSYNITWWFNKLIIALWLIFPLLYWCAQKKPLLTLIVSLMINRFWESVVGPGLFEMYIHQLPFVLGVLWQTVKLKSDKTELFLKEHPWLFPILSLFMVAIFACFRMRPVIPNWYGLRMDAFLTCSICLFVVSTIKDGSWLSLGLAFLGKHSGNIYLTHTFFNCYWHLEWLHSSQFMRSGANFFVLLGLSLLASVLLEYMKQHLGVYSLANKITDRLK